MLQQGKYSGVYRALVVNNEDKEHLGRIQIRVPGIHGDEKDISDENLPYALPCFPYASYEEGCFIIPPIGSMVFVLFENNEHTRPIYIGQMFSKGYNEAVEYKQSGLTNTTENKYVKPANINETIVNAYDGDKPKKKILYKTSKGQSIEFNDNDNKESVYIHDNIGQCIGMYSPMDESFNTSLTRRRGIFSILKEKFKYQLTSFSLLILKAINGSKLRFTSKPDSSDTDLLCVYQDEKAGILINVGGSNRILMQMKDSTLEIKQGEIILKANKISLNTPNFACSASNLQVCAHDGALSRSVSSPSSFQDTEIEKSVGD